MQWQREEFCGAYPQSLLSDSSASSLHRASSHFGLQRNDLAQACTCLMPQCCAIWQIGSFQIIVDLSRWLQWLPPWPPSSSSLSVEIHMLLKGIAGITTVVGEPSARPPPVSGPLGPQTLPTIGASYHLATRASECEAPLNDTALTAKMATL
jgi:hypothetical protein